MTELAPSVQNTVTADDETLRESIVAMVGHDRFPCLGARSVFRQDHAVVRVYDELGSRGATAELLTDLASFADEVEVDAGFASFVAIFRAPTVHTEERFEELLWSQLSELNAADDQAWNPHVSADPSHDHFAYSVGGYGLLRRRTAPSCLAHRQTSGVTDPGLQPARAVRGTARLRPVRPDARPDPAA